MKENYCENLVKLLKCGKTKKESPKTFYYYFKPLAVVSRLLGVLPLSDLSDCYSLKFSYISFPVIYSIFLFLCSISLIGVYNTSDIEAIANSKDIGLIWVSVLMLIMVIRSLACCFFCAVHSKKIVKLIQILDVFDMKKQKYFKDDDKTNFHRTTVRPLVIGGIMTCVLSVNLWNFSRANTEEIITEGMANVGLVVFGFLGVWQVLPLLLYNYFAITISRNLEGIVKVISEMSPLKKWCLQTPPSCASCNAKEVLRSVRVLHLLTSDAVQYLSNSYGSFLAIDQFYVIVMYVLGIYVYFFTGNANSSLIYCAVIDGMIVLSVVYISHDVSEKVSRKGNVKCDFFSCSVKNKIN